MSRRRITRRHHLTRLHSSATLKALIQSEIGDFFAGVGSTGEPETPEAMQRELMIRIDNIFDFFYTKYGIKQK
ncbi:hypothetical protein G9L14_001817 [Escherichia coli]|nr:hypothetical protein [Escherichia coli]EHK9947255.1 hypothetical protein [Escherichia coli]